MKISLSHLLLLCPVSIAFLSNVGTSLRTHTYLEKKKRSPAAAGGFGGLVKDFQKKTFSYTGSITPKSSLPQREIPPSLPDISIPDYARSGKPVQKEENLPWIITQRTENELAGMKEAGVIARKVLDHAGSLIKPGVSTDEIDSAVYDLAYSLGAYPSPLNYHGFPKACCISINEIVCHGIPSEQLLKEGDIVNVDITVYKNGVHGDCSEMFVVGDAADVLDDRGKELLQVTYDCWLAACKSVRPGMLYRDIGTIIEDYITPHKFTTVKGFCGHGIGPIFHCNPNVLHYRNDQKTGVMDVGHTFTIEPMICENNAQTVTWPDDWTVATKDGGRSAQFEHTLLVTEDGVKPLTGKLPSSPVQWWEQNSKLHKGVWKGEGSDMNE